MRERHAPDHVIPLILLGLLVLGALAEVGAYHDQPSEAQERPVTPCAAVPGLTQIPCP
jgi:hypothetical protein